MSFFAKFAMVASFLIFSIDMTYLWVGQIAGWHNEIWSMFDFPPQESAPPLWSLLVGVVISVFGLTCLAMTYSGIWQILNGGPGQDFRDLARRMRRIGFGLIGFWAAYNLLVGLLPWLITANLSDRSDFDFVWDPLDIDLLILLMGIAILAISQTLRRAWEAEEENNAFL